MVWALRTMLKQTSDKERKFVNLLARFSKQI
jgi:hypothetical protein